MKYALIIKKMRAEYDARKAEVLKNPEDYNFYELAIKYELCEWVDYLLQDFDEDVDGEKMEYLYKKTYPLAYLYELYCDREDYLHDDFADMLDYDIKWHKDHKE